MIQNEMFHPSIIIVCNLEPLNIKENLRENEIYFLHEQILRVKQIEEATLKYWVGTYWTGFAPSSMLNAREKSDDFSDFADALKAMSWIWKGRLKYVRSDFQEILWQEFQNHKANSDEVTKNELEQIEAVWAKVCGKLNKKDSIVE